jgi:hypothetical protein
MRSQLLKAAFEKTIRLHSIATMSMMVAVVLGNAMILRVFYRAAWFDVICGSISFIVVIGLYSLFERWRSLRPGSFIKNEAMCVSVYSINKKYCSQEIVASVLPRASIARHFSLLGDTAVVWGIDPPNMWDFHGVAYFLIRRDKDAVSDVSIILYSLVKPLGVGKKYLERTRPWLTPKRISNALTKLIESNQDE